MANIDPTKLLKELTFDGTLVKFQTSGGDYNIESVDDGDGGQVLYITDAEGAKVIEPLTVTENRVYDAPDGIDGYNPVTVDVKPTYPDEYVSDGLIMRLDAIENTRNGHDASVDVWEDISGNGHDLSLTLGDMPIIGDDFYYFFAGQLKTQPFTTTETSSFKYAELILQTAHTGNEASSRLVLGGYSSAGFMTTWYKGNPMIFYCGIDAFSNNTNYVRNVDRKPDTVQNLALIRDGVVLEDNKIIAPKYNVGTWASLTDKTLSFGAYRELGSYNARCYILAFRLYDHLLTEEEREQNYQQDLKRFGENRVIGLEELFNALPDLQGGSKTIYVSSTQKAAASADVIKIATDKGWTVA